MNYNEVVTAADSYLLPMVSELYDMKNWTISRIASHEGGRNVVYRCEKPGEAGRIIRISFLPDRSEEDILAEVEYVRYLAEHGASVANVICSVKNRLMEKVTYQEHNYYICLFEKAPGKLLVENNYRYRDGVPLTEYFYNCGKVLGKMHKLSKDYHPVRARYSFFDKYSHEYINQLIPDTYCSLKKKMIELVDSLKKLDTGRNVYGMVHFDYSDGNYMINFDDGQITVYDFDNACYCWYMFDLANLWTHGVGWIQFEPDVQKRKKYMDDYFEKIVEGYTSETELDPSMLEQLPLFIQVVLLENIVDEFECMKIEGEEPEEDEELAYRIKCMEENIPYMGFFHEIYSCKEPFVYEEER